MEQGNGVSVAVHLVIDASSSYFSEGHVKLLGDGVSFGIVGLLRVLVR
jgi:hypothetical protein